MGTSVRIACASLLALASLTSVAAPVAQAGTPTTCRVRNVTQGASGSSFPLMVRRARAGDRLVIRGRCRSVDVMVERDMTLVGAGDWRPILTGALRGRVLEVASGAVVIVRHLRITRGFQRFEPGGGILNEGQLTLVDSRVDGNEAPYGSGIHTRRGDPRSPGGRMELIRSIVENNGGGSAISTDSDDDLGPQRLTLRDSIVRDNEGTGLSLGHVSPVLVVDSRIVRNGGRGISNAGPLTVRRSVVRANRGGGIRNDNDAFEEYGNVLLVDSIVSRNTTSDDGAGIRNLGGTFTIRRSLVTANVTKGSGGGIYNADFYGDYRGRVVIEGGSAVTANLAGAAGGGIYHVAHDGGWVQVSNDSVIGGNTPDDCFGTDAC